MGIQFESRHKQSELLFAFSFFPFWNSQFNVLLLQDKLNFICKLTEVLKYNIRALRRLVWDSSRDADVQV